MMLSEVEEGESNKNESHLGDVLVIEDVATSDAEAAAPVSGAYDGLVCEVKNIQITLDYSLAKFVSKASFNTATVMSNDTISSLARKLERFDDAHAGLRQSNFTVLERIQSQQAKELELQRARGNATRGRWSG